MWVGDVIYFLSDRDGPVSLFFYDLKRKQVGRLSRLGTADIKSAAASAGAIAYEQFGSLHLLDLRSGRDTALDLRPMGDFSETRPRRLSVVDIVESPSSFFKPAMVPGLAPDGASAAFAVRGEIVAASVEEGKSRVLTHTSNAVERDPVWSPDGRSIAYFSDESGEYALHVRAASGDGTVDKIDLGSPPGFYHSPVWSPDSSKIAYGDQNLGYWYMDLRKRVPVKVDSNPYAQPLAAQWIWSPDSRSLAYTKQLTNRLHAVFIYSLAERESRQLTDGMSDALYPAFDPTGGRLYFTASITVGSKPMTRCVYAVALHPFRRGETQPVVRLPIAERNYYGLWAGKDGVLYLTEAPQTDDSFRLILGDPALTVQRFDPRTGETKAILGQISHLNVSYAGSKLLYATQAQGERRRWLVASDGKPGVPLKFGSLALDVEPRTEWRHMYEQVWRNERDFFYDPGLHGLDLVATKEKYRAFVDRIASRDDLDYLFREMLSNLAVGHMTIAGPDSTLLKPRASGIGLLGADYLVEHGRYRFARIYAADPWSSQSRSPLAEPGKMVRPGEYLLAVNGRKARSSVDVYSYFVGTAGKPTVLSVGPHSNGRDARDIMVVPVDDESGLRHFAWIESNRRKVAEMTGGRVAYLHMPDTALAGAASFNRYFFAQRDKEALILDERYNLGGFSSEYLVDALRRPLRNYVHPRAGKDMAAPDDALFGPKALLINEMAGSGGDYLAWMFRDARLGPLIGKRTWGGLVGNYLNPGDLLDGGFVATPNAGFYNRNGDWEIENRGVPPDIEVEDDPKTTSVARDAQLEKAVEWVLARLQESQSTAGGVSHHVHEQTVFP
jgi:tricorn protease